MIEIEHLSKRYGKYTALDDLSLRVDDGEIFGFLGPNGAGKTTTIKSIAGLIKPSQGLVRVDGHSVHKQPLKAKAQLGVIPDRPFLYEKLTGLEYLRFLAGLYGLDAARAERAAHNWLDVFRLGSWGNELIEGYSHGMKQRLVMAGAFIHSPHNLVVDEPMVGLDPEGARLVKAIFRAWAGRGHSLFVSTHSLPEAEELCDRIGILSRGRLVAIGSLDQLRERARTRGDLEEVFLTLTREAEVEGQAVVRDAATALDLDAALELSMRALPDADGNVPASSDAKPNMRGPGGAA
ncbi:MAG: ABC transporter ATP-binding protein [Pseudomonadota bacterium]